MRLKHLFFVVLGIFFSIKTYSQDFAAIDSLLKIVNSNVHDTIRANELNEIAWEWRRYNLDSAVHYAEQAKNISIKAQYQKGESTALTRIGQANEYHGKLNDAISAYRAAYMLDSISSYAFGMARATSQIASIYSRKGNFTKSVLYGERSIKSFQEIENLPALVNTYLITGYAYANLGEDKKALQNYNRAFTIADSINFYTGISKSLTYKGILYESQGRYRQSLDCYLQSLNIQKNFEDSQALNTLYSNIGNLYYQIKEPDSSLFYYSKILKKQNIELNNQQKANLYHNIALPYLFIGNVDSALMYYNKSFLLRKESDDKAGLSRSYLLEGKVKLKKGDQKGADKSLEKSLNLAKEVKDTKLIEEICESIADIYKNKGDFENAFKYLNHAYELMDSIAVKENQSFEFESMQQQLTIIQGKLDLEIVENARKNTTIISLVLGAVLLIIISLLYLQSYKRRKNFIIAQQNEKLAQKEVESLMKDKELQRYAGILEGQDKEREKISRDLHDELGATLAMVRNYFSTFEKPIESLGHKDYQLYAKADTLLKDAIGKVRNLSHELGNSQLINVGLERAIRILGKSVEESAGLIVGVYSFGLEGRLERDIETNLYKIVQELLMNIVKHAQATEATVQLLQNEDEVLTITVEDNGKGFDPNKINDSSSMGFLNIRTRLNQTNGQLEVDSGLGRGTHITMTIPIKLTETKTLK